MSGFSTGSAVVVVPTYNEADNLPRLIEAILALDNPPDILVVDDGSPDGTGDIADVIAAADPRVEVLHRLTKSGLGDAYRAGFERALGTHSIVVQMDADGSHRVADLVKLIDAADRGFLAVGSRRVEGGGSVEWAKSRVALSSLGAIWTRIMTGVRVYDPTSGFRAWPVDTLRDIDFATTTANGFAFQIETLLRAADLNLPIQEVAIMFLEREHGVSKMDRSIVFEALALTAKWGAKRRLADRRRRRATALHA